MLWGISVCYERMCFMSKFHSMEGVTAYVLRKEAVCFGALSVCYGEHDLGEDLSHRQSPPSMLSLCSGAEFVDGASSRGPGWSF